MATLSVYVPNGESRQETAVLLVGTAEEHGIDQREIRASNGGFFISEALADLLYDDQPGEPAPVKTEDKTSTTKTSGNRAAKNSTTEKE
jgi:hypothetical protein